MTLSLTNETGARINNVERDIDIKINDVKLMMHNQEMSSKKHVAESIDNLRDELKNDIRINENASVKRYTNTQQYIQELKAQIRFNRNMILAFIAVSIAHIIFSVIGVL